MPMETVNTTAIDVTNYNNWYKNNPPYCQVVKLTSDTIPNSTFTAFSTYSGSHGMVLNRNYTFSFVPFVNVAGSVAVEG